MLINLTNHPFAEWDEKQQKSAVEAYEKVIDLPFPAIDAHIDKPAMITLCENYVFKIDALAQGKPYSVHVMGEMTFTHNIIKLLHLKGIECIASCSERFSEKIDTGKKQVLFRFVRFRAY